VVRVTPQPLFTTGKDLVPVVQEAGSAPGPVWTGAENIAPYRDSIPRRLLPYKSVMSTTILPCNIYYNTAL
jgi:hypothetical protein